MSKRNPEDAEPFDPAEAAWRPLPDAMGTVEFFARLTLAAGWADEEEAWR